MRFSQKIKFFISGKQMDPNIDVTNRGKNIANQNNTVEVRIASSYKISDFNVSHLPNRVYEVCKNLQLLELEYLVPHAVDEGEIDIGFLYCKFLITSI